MCCSGTATGCRARRRGRWTCALRTACRVRRAAGPSLPACKRALHANALPRCCAVVRPFKLAAPRCPPLAARAGAQDDQRHSVRAAGARGRHAPGERPAGEARPRGEGLPPGALGAGGAPPIPCMSPRQSWAARAACASGGWGAHASRPGACLRPCLPGGVQCQQAAALLSAPWPQDVLLAGDMVSGRGCDCWRMFPCQCILACWIILPCTTSAAELAG